MTKQQVKEILDRVLTWPLERQEDAARVLDEMERQDGCSMPRRTAMRKVSGV
jgi:hypothetical protein